MYINLKNTIYRYMYFLMYIKYNLNNISYIIFFFITLLFVLNKLS